MLTISAPAKINLTLEVVGWRSDGYHEVRSIFQTVDLCDTLSFKLAEWVSLRSNEPGLESPENLVLKAASLLHEVSGCNKGVSIELTKGIPLISGLGGGASDAAATLKGLNQLWEIGLPMKELLSLASRLSSDTAFFLYGGTALVQGRGEIVSQLPPFPSTYVILLLPPLPRMAGKTGRLYASLSAADFTQGEITGRAAELLQSDEGTASFLLFNVFERVAFEVFSGIAGYWERLLQAGATSVHLAGAGPALFALVKDKAEATKIYRDLQQGGLECYLAQTCAAAG